MSRKGSVEKKICIEQLPFFLPALAFFVLFLNVSKLWDMISRGGQNKKNSVFDKKLCDRVADLFAVSALGNS